MVEPLGDQDNYSKPARIYLVLSEGSLTPNLSVLLL